MLIEYNNKLFYTSKDLALSVIGGRWKIPIIYHLLQSEVLRLSELEKKLPDINQRMLIRQLRELEKDIRDFCNAKLAEYKWIRIVEFVSEMPKTISGKIRKSELRKR